MTSVESNNIAAAKYKGLKMPGRGALRPRRGERQDVVLDVEVGEQQGQEDEEVSRQGE